MNKKFEILMKAAPFLSGFFILAGLIMAILSALDNNVQIFYLSLFLILQSVLALTYAKLFKKIWQK
ncbi:hypothetical protein [Parageobacillus thermoglucosidasius]|uniref:hypothetical protein n=1 Tax=Parageobacillus thermoglucosidasius TaxID=1426 RepID=UPI000B58148C|nr:hypothetical protein [Parageobacillus thermoglucosidasius]MBY6268562.1 hypothetical protein [Parageobacillus thermoglucosidasius]MED4903631.1 hypothetical protein [Parageobacillus thermoglucosidasius]MED4912699.1 hypothetical protein [Parageobacillus thermoglucosidasius]MED4944491.1 hypothetical protein [Parageobacillus thermoglucosidasius]MED4982089.1 hypothetical protein [Parageobacillus thermoglucosidasius]